MVSGGGREKINIWVHQTPIERRECVCVFCVCRFNYGRGQSGVYCVPTLSGDSKGKKIREKEGGAGFQRCTVHIMLISHLNTMKISVF